MLDMNAQTRACTFPGEAGEIEALVDEPVPCAGLALQGTAVIAHPHPLFAGTMDNKVVQTLARAFVSSGWRAVRFNFRGVGRSGGVYDNGVAEARDLLTVLAAAAPEGSVSLAGFSFGAMVTARALALLGEDRAVERVVLVGTAASRFEVPPIAPSLRERTLVVHGEADDTVPLSSVMDWARPQVLPVVVVPGGGHFFHGQLPLLRGLVARHLAVPR